MGSPVKKRILCVNDSGDECEFFSFVLALAGFEVESARSEEDLLSVSQNSLFDLCLLNISLKESTGFEWLEKVQAIAPSIPLIICSDIASEALRQQAMLAGVCAFFTSPIDFDLLVTIITQLLEPSTEN
ncbi:response regulator [Chroococcus sp. FPU101]|uniref:response regulator n=1 Tax=Chroococcus sp. FPU101 TaxID=1974212 RepID=UPI001A8F3A09|nr:response regulator [Chroococcus sp. FPU101]GFE72045.1 hypothetical protein CFPU101_46550 [Chroococcus sp. FPU101]